MSVAESRARYNEILLDRVRDVRFPSRELMDRIELSLRDRDAALEYVSVLFDKVQGRYPSLELLDRIDLMLLLLERYEIEEEASSEA